MSSRKYPSGSIKRKRKAEKLLVESKKQTNSVLDKYLVRVEDESSADCVGTTQILESAENNEKIHTVLDISMPPIQTNDVETIMLKRTEDNTENCDNGDVSKNDLIQTAYPVNSISTSGNEFVMYDSDPALWPKTTQRMRDFFAQNKPDQNISFLKNSGRMFGSKMRKCNESNFFRQKKNGELVKRNWLIYSISSNALFCYICKLYSNSSDALCTSGLTDWQNLTKRLSSHEISKVHQQSVNCLSQLLCASKRVDSMFVKENESERVYWRNVLRNMSGKYSGLQTRLKSDCPLAEFVPCSGHSLNLVGVNAVESCQSAVSYFGFVQALYKFFSGSPHRWEILTSELKKTGCFTLKCLSETRWSANADAVKALRKGYNIISNTLLEMGENENENAATKYEAKCLYKKIQIFENALLTIIWDTLLQRINFTSKSIQSYTCDIEAIVPLYDSLESFVNNIRGSFEILEKEASTIVGGISYSKSRKRRIPNMLDDSMSADASTDFSERDKFIFQTHYVICDSLILNLNKRKKEYHILQNRFSFLTNRNNLSKPQLCEAVKKFQEVYTKDIGEEFVDEFLQFSEFMPSLNNATEMLKMINTLQIEHTYPNVEVALRIFLCIPVSNCSGERSFSAMKRIKTRLRASMSSERLSGLALLTMENDLTKSLSFEEIINDFLCNKSRKKQM